MAEKEISFIAKKKITEPVKIKFRTSDGEMVEFKAIRESVKPVRVKFKIRK